MTKKDYQLIATIISGVPDLLIRKQLADRFCAALAADNPYFDEVRFYWACHPNG